MKRKIETGLPAAPKGAAKAEQQPTRLRERGAVSHKQATAGLLLTGGLSSLTSIATLAGECVTLGEHAPSSSDFFDASMDICGHVSNGNMRAVESMLMTQAMSLSLLSNAMMSRATRSLGTSIDRFDSYMRLALKAQNQSRMTLETLANVKNPPVLYARQANINNGGQQQVNNGAAPAASHAASAGAVARAGDSANGQTELMESEASDGKRLDTGTTRTAIQVDPHMETVGAGHRAAER